MNDMLFIIISGIVAIIILLANYLYIKRVTKKPFLAARKDILLRLAYELGRGKTLTLIHVQSIIDEILLKNGLKLGAISPNEAIEDLVREIIPSLPFEEAEKEELARSLCELNSKGK